MGAVAVLPSPGSPPGHRSQATSTCAPSEPRRATRGPHPAAVPVVGGQQRVADRGAIEPTSHREYYLQAGDASSILITRSIAR